MCFGNTPVEMALALLEDGIPEEALADALLAAQANLGLADADLPFAVAD